jgi:class 3 adenylate cyclase/tetratricopeptide (TPR) repeat protein
MKCFACRSDNRKGVRFCEECGTHIAIACPRCDSRIPVGKKYCGDCGQKLTQDENLPEKPPGKSVVDYAKPDSYTPKFMAEKILTTRGSLEGERKLVTVFFCDVTGFTSFSETLDPEAVHQIMDGCFKILMDQIHKYEGTINQFTGDGAMALFGAPLAHEDHAQRACHAALAIQQALAQYAQTVKNEFGLDFKMRIGLNSGPVVVGAIGDDLRMDYTAVGDTTNLAARMESLADPGTILISDSTFRLVKTYFQVASLGKVDVKGKKDQQAIYKLTGVSGIKSRLDASKDRGLIEYIGRKEEIEDLVRILKKVNSSRGQVVGVVGEAGIGKSRFVLEMHGKADEQVYIETRCLQHSSNIPFLPILQSLKSFLDIGEGESEGKINQKLKTKLNGLDKDLMAFLPAFRHFLSLPTKDNQWENFDPKEKRAKIFEAIRNLFIRLSQDAPLVLIIDDLQWLDKTSEEFISYFIEWISNTKILLLLLYRPEYGHKWGSRSFYNQIGIYPMSQEESKTYISCLLNKGEISPQIEEVILQRTSGNPLFMEELMYMLLENGTILKENNSYRLNKTASDHQVPDSIQGIIAGRMDRLEDNIKATMQTAAVIGRSFAFKILKTLPGVDNEIKFCLLRLQSLELIYEKRVFPELEYIFRNIITQEVAYNSLLFNRRKEIHGSVGMAIEQIYSSRIAEFYEVIAHHFSRSHNHKRALKYLKLSGDKAIQNNSAWEAFVFYKKAFEIIEQDIKGEEKQKLEILHAMVSPIIILNFPEGSLKFLQQGVTVSKALDDQKSLIRFYSNVGFFHSTKGRHEEGSRFSGKAFEKAVSIDDLTAMAQAAPDLCLANFATGRYHKVIEVSSIMIDAIRKEEKEKDHFGGPAIVFPALFSFSGYSLAHLGKIDKGMANCVYGLEEALDSDSLFTQSICLYYAGMTLLLQGAWAEAKTYFEHCLEGMEQVDFAQIEAVSKSGLGVAKAYTGDPVGGQILCREGLRLLKDAGVKWQISTIQYFAGICYHRSGDLENALTNINQSLMTATKSNEVFYKGAALIWKGRILGKLPSPLEDAEQLIMEGVEILTSLDAAPEIAKGYLFLGELYARRDQQKAAGSYLKKAKVSFQKMKMDYWLEQTRKTMAL